MKEGMAYFTDTHLTVIGLILFFVFFCTVVWWTSLKENKTLYKNMEQLPLDEGDSL